MAPPGAWWFAPDGWVGWVSMKPGDRGISAGAGKGVCRNGQPQQGDKVSSAILREERRKAGGQAMRKTESQAYGRITAGFEGGCSPQR